MLYLIHCILYYSLDQFLHLKYSKIIIYCVRNEKKKQKRNVNNANGPVASGRSKTLLIGIDCAYKHPTKQIKIIVSLPPCII